MSQRLTALAETPAQARCASILAPQAAIVALSPAADYWCEQAGRPAISIETLCAETDLYPLGEANIGRIEALSDRVDSLADRFLGRFPEQRDLSLRAFFHFLKANCDGIVIRIEQVWRAIDALKPRRLGAFQMPAYEVTGITSFDKPAWGLASRLVPPIARVHGTPIEWLEASEQDAQGHGEAVTRRAARSPSLPSRIAGLLRLLVSRHQGVSALPDAPLLLHALFGDLGVSIIERWKARGFRAAILSEFLAQNDVASDQAWQDAAQELWSAVKNDEVVRGLLSHRGVEFSEWLAPQLGRIILERYPAMLAASRRAERHFPGLQRSLIVAGGIVDTHYVIARAARRWNIPFVSHHYGGFVGFSLLPMHERYDLAECDYFLCGGLGSRDTLREPSPLSRWNPKVRRARPVAVGLPWLDAEYRSQRRGRMRRPGRRVMVVVNAIVGDCRYLGYVFPPEIAYWRFKRRVISELTRLGMEVIVKLPLSGRYPQHAPPLETWLSERNRAAVEIIRDVPLQDCLDRADAFVLESPSTPLLHVVATDKPLLLYVDRTVYRLVPTARELLRERCALFAESKEEFFAQLPRWAAHFPSRKAYPVDDRFLVKFLLGKTSSRAAERTARFLERVATGHPLSDDVLDSISRENSSAA
jgi:hypothetical protein